MYSQGCTLILLRVSWLWDRPLSSSSTCTIFSSHLALMRCLCYAAQALARVWQLWDLVVWMTIAWHQQESVTEFFLFVFSDHPYRRRKFHLTPKTTGVPTTITRQYMCVQSQLAATELNWEFVTKNCNNLSQTAEWPDWLSPNNAQPSLYLFYEGAFCPEFPKSLVSDSKDQVPCL